MMLMMLTMKMMTTAESSAHILANRYPSVERSGGTNGSQKEKRKLFTQKEDKTIEH